ncbi:MAG: hypothetical protein PUE18_03775 [Firmicutes bacterium]|nr:hypothetical protein [Bacillota bacterium]
MLTIHEIENIILSAEEIRILKQLKKHDAVYINRADAQNLSHNKLIQQNLKWINSEQVPWDGTWIITENGINFLKHNFETKKRFYFVELRAWITLAISIASFILAIVALIS